MDLEVVLQLSYAPRSQAATCPASACLRNGSKSKFRYEYNVNVPQPRMRYVDLNLRCPVQQLPAQLLHACETKCLMCSQCKFGRHAPPGKEYTQQVAELSRRPPLRLPAAKTLMSLVKKEHGSHCSPTPSPASSRLTATVELSFGSSAAYEYLLIETTRDDHGFCLKQSPSKSPASSRMTATLEPSCGSSVADGSTMSDVPWKPHVRLTGVAASARLLHEGQQIQRCC